MLALDLLRVVLAWIVLCRSEMTHVRASRIGMIVPDPKRIQQRFELQKNLIFPATKHRGSWTCSQETLLVKAPRPFQPAYTAPPIDLLYVST